MDLFRLSTPTFTTTASSGEIINNVKSKLWIERYRDAGEFKIVGTLDTGLREMLPIGSFVSHVDTQEIMIVENHEISESEDKLAEVTITGRGLETILDQRILGANSNFAPNANAWAGLAETVLPIAGPAAQAQTLLLRNVINPTFVLDLGNQFPNLVMWNSIGNAGEQAERTIKRGSLYTRVLELLAIEDYGIRVYRPGLLSQALLFGLDDLVLVLHDGVDRTATIAFSYDESEIKSADYLWSNKAHKNAAYVYGRYVEAFVDTADEGYARRVMIVEASDLDDALTAVPQGLAFTAIRNKMLVRGRERLAAQKMVILNRAEISPEQSRYRFRRDYDVGDLITVQGNYNTSTSMRVIEYVETEDENGRISYPTLAII